MAPINPAPTTTKRTKMLPLFTNTTCGPESISSSWEFMYKMLEDEKTHKVKRKGTANALDSSKATIKEEVNSFLHQFDA